jgi:replicative DNA helicase
MNNWTKQHERASKQLIGTICMNPSLIGATEVSPEQLYGRTSDVMDRMDDVDGVESFEKLLDHPDFLEQLYQVDPDEDWSAFINECINMAPTSEIEGLKAVESSVKKANNVRNIRSMADSMDTTQMTYDEIQQATEQMADETVISNGTGQSLVDDEDMQSLDEWFETQRRRGFKKGILTTGYPSLDDAIMGIRRTDLVIISAETGVGKTTLGLNIVDHIASEGGTVLIFSLEMPKGVLQKRMLSYHSGVRQEKLFKGGLNDTDIQRLKDAKKTLRNQDIYVLGKQDDIREITGKAREMVEQHDVDFMMTDYLQELNNHLGEQASRNEYYEDAAQTLKDFAMRHEVPQLLISSLNKDGTVYYTSQSEFKCDSHLRLKDANPDDDGEHDGPKRRTLTTAKNRHGPGGSIALEMDGQRSRIFLKGSRKR